MSETFEGLYTGVASVALHTQARIAIARTADIVMARQTGRSLVQRLGFSANKSIIVATAISELARNIILYAKSGVITIARRNKGARVGVVVEALDTGPGIPDVQNAMEGGYSTSGGLGLGLSGVREMADEFAISSHVGQGTTVAVTIWL